MSLKVSLFLVLVVMLSVFIIHSCGSEVIKEPPETLKAENILPHLEELSDDRYMGRMPFGPGDKMSVDYLVEQCKKLGLKPGNNGSYTQSVPMVEITSSSTEDITVTTPEGKKMYQFGKDYVIHSQKTIDQIEIDESELVF